MLGVANPPPLSDDMPVDFSVLATLCLISPPFLVCWLLVKFVQRGRQRDGQQRPKWRFVVEWGAVIAVSIFFVACVVAFFAIPCNVDVQGWECVAKWRSFTGYVVRLSPVLLVLASFGRKGTRIISALLVLATAFDCVLVDMMA
jgi:hypothetical protein